MVERSLYEKLTRLFENETNLILSKSIVGTTDAESLTEFVNDFCKTYLKSEVGECLYAGLSVGASFGLKLNNGQEIFLKINKPNNDDSIAQCSFEGMKAISTVQEKLSEYQFPCPKVIISPVEYRDVIVTVNSYEDIGAQIDAHNPSIRKSIAEKYAELIKRTDPFIKTEGFKYFNFYKNDKLFPTPHNALFDFNKAGTAANWIDNIASRSKKIINSIPENLVLGHCDWSLKHFRFVNDEMIMIYDWDSLCLQDEYHLLGIAASTFTTTWDIPVKITPSQHEAYEFVREYESVRGKKFTKEELMKISACSTYIMSYTARCELAVDPDNNNFEGSFRQALSKMTGDNYLGI
ncbi:hypothetical protein [Clostridium folliculivorans]|uniref:Aminoglycoside phosphotransferase domain-containing protein n=1 Tax=Clostridium folliculivorans TaxID=2886038 RepID=A0A9W5Y201_9CLOT|nr:hypothetical protein [Clostridium folliculivorans]GKU25057.1 hypothetical protein CFOLD11_18830 [Clostridium folliculivorans]GKU31155.1 hypothetical protein CFB3_32620 [Clostridium folliculivorans]